jgi:hypothetical protein
MPLTQVSPGLLDSNAATLSFKNRIINPFFQIDQRNSGAAHNVSTSPAYGTDRWLMQSAGATGTAQQSGWPAGFGFISGLALTGASGVTNLTASQRIERNNCADLAGTTANISISAYSATATTLSWALYYPTANDNYSGLTLITTGSWTITSTANRYSATVAIPAAATTGLQLTISTGALAAGQTTFITGVQLAPGNQPSEIERRPFGNELAMCQRYYYQTWGFGSFTNIGGGYAGQVLPSANNATSYGTGIFPTAMRAAPTVTLYDSLGSSGNVSQPAIANGLAATAGNISMSGFLNVTKSSTTFTVGTPVICQFVASIEL